MEPSCKQKYRVLIFVILDRDKLGCVNVTISSFSDNERLSSLAEFADLYIWSDIVLPEAGNQISAI